MELFVVVGVACERTALAIDTGLLRRFSALTRFLPVIFDVPFRHGNAAERRNEGQDLECEDGVEVKGKTSLREEKKH